MFVSKDNYGNNYAKVYSVKEFDSSYFVEQFNVYSYSFTNAYKKNGPAVVTTADLLSTLHRVEQKAMMERPGTFLTLASLLVLAKNGWVDMGVSFGKDKDMSTNTSFSFINLTPTDEPYWMIRIWNAAIEAKYYIPHCIIDNSLIDTERVELYVNAVPDAESLIRKEDPELNKVWFTEKPLKTRKGYTDRYITELPKDCVVINDGTTPIPKEEVEPKPEDFLFL